MKNITKKAFFAPLVGIALIGAIVFMACPTEPTEDEDNYTIKFVEAWGGTPIVTAKIPKSGDGVVTRGVYAAGVGSTTWTIEQILALPSITAGLYKDGVERNPDTMTYMDGSTERAFTFGNTIKSDIEIKATWQAPARVSGVSDLAGGITSAKSAPGKYAYFLDAAANIGPQTLDYPGVELTLIGLNSERRITLIDGPGRLFTVGASGNDTTIKLTIGKNITLAGVTDNNGSLVQVKNKASFTMLDGSKITGNGSTAIISDAGARLGQGAAVHVGTGRKSDDPGTGGTFTMLGGEITGNTGGGTGATSQVNGIVGGLYADSSSVINLEGGSIKGNTTNAFSKNVFFTHTCVVTLKGNADIADITLNSQGTNFNTMTLSDFTGAATVNLRNTDTTTTNAVATAWLGKDVVKGTGVDKIITGNFLVGTVVANGDTGTTNTAISATHRLSAAGTLIAIN